MLFRLLGLVVLLASLAGGWMLREYQLFLRQPVRVVGPEVTVTIARGSGLRGVADTLSAAGVLSHPWFFEWEARLSGRAREIKAGEYAIKRGMTPPQVLALLVSGQVVEHPFTIVDGWTFRQLRAALAASPYLDHTLGQADRQTVMARIGAPGIPAEGAFLPDTYLFPSGTKDVAVLARAHRAMQRFLAAQWAERAPHLPYSKPEQALIMASLVEKETALPSERARIAGVFVRRLRRNMRLETDPTVIYALGERYHGVLTRADMRFPSPFNTYLHRGLPPTPICMPGRAAIEAALHPARGDALYFVATGDGAHHFSVTFAQHRRAIARYLLGEDRGRAPVAQPTPSQDHRHGSH